MVYKPKICYIHNINVKDAMSNKIIMPTIIDPTKPKTVLDKIDKVLSNYLSLSNNPKSNNGQFYQF